MEELLLKQHSHNMCDYRVSVLHTTRHKPAEYAAQKRNLRAEEEGADQNDQDREDSVYHEQN